MKPPNSVASRSRSVKVKAETFGGPTGNPENLRKSGEKSIEIWD